MVDKKTKRVAEQMADGIDPQMIGSLVALIRDYRKGHDDKRQQQWESPTVSCSCQLCCRARELLPKREA